MTHCELSMRGDGSMNGPITGDPILDGLRGLPRLEPSERATVRICARSLAVLE